MSKQISAIDRLRELPLLFRGAHLTTRFRWDSKTASQYLYLWKRRNLVQGLGGHSDVFANLLFEPFPQYPNWEKALLMTMPSAVIVGVEVLRRVGWTTQIPTRPNVAVSAKQPVFKTNFFEIEARDLAWFATVASGIRREGGVPTLAPSWALADMLKREGWGTCGLWPDDLDLEPTDQDEADWRAACLAFGMPETRLIDQSELSR